MLVAFDLSDPFTFENVKIKWIPEAKEFAPGKPWVLVGCRRDRVDAGQRRPGKILSQEMLDLSKACDAAGYFETSAHFGHNVYELLERTASLALERPDARHHKSNSLEKFTKGIGALRGLRIVA